MQEGLFSLMADQEAGSLAHKREKKQGRKRRPRVFDPSRSTGKVTPFNGNAGGSLCYGPSGSYCSHASLLPHQPPLLPVPLLPASIPRYHSLPSGNYPNIYSSQGLSSSDELYGKAKTVESAGVVRSLKEQVNSQSRGVAFPNGLGLSRSSSARLPNNRRDLGFESLSSTEVVVISSPPPSCLPLPKFSLRTRQDASISCTTEAGAVDGGTDTLRSLLYHR